MIPRRRLINARYGLGVLLLAGLVVGLGWKTSVVHSEFQEQRAGLLGLDPNDIPGAVNLLRQMPDPIERGLAAEQWVVQNRGNTDTARAVVICQQLPDLQVKACERHLSSAHLRR